MLYGPDSFAAERYRQMYRYFPEGAVRVLDVGCGTGQGGFVLKKIDPRLKITGLDREQENLEKLPKDCYDHVIHGEVPNILCADDSFDVVVAGEFIEHLYPANVDQMIAEIFRVLQIGGRLLLTTPNPQDIKRRMSHGHVLGGTHVSQHFHSALRIKLRMTGFANVKVFGSGKVTRVLGDRFPLFIYGSYLAIGDKI